MYAATAFIALAAAAVQTVALVNHPGMAAPETAAQKAQTPAGQAGVGASLSGKEFAVMRTHAELKSIEVPGGAQ